MLLLWHGTRGVPASCQWGMEKVRTMLVAEDLKVKEAPFSLIVQNMHNVAGFRFKPKPKPKPKPAFFLIKRMRS